MRRLALLIVVFLIASTLAITAIPAASTQSLPGDQAAVGVLTLDTETRTEFSSQSLNVAAALGNQHQETKTRLNRYAFNVAFAEAESDGARRGVLIDATSDLDYQLQQLTAQDHRLRAQYANGSIEEAAYIRGLARIDREARELERNLDRIDRAADRVPQPGVNPDIRRLRTEIVGLAGPVRGQAAVAMTGERPPARFYIEAASNGLVLSGIDSGRYEREAVRTDHRSSEVDPSFDLDSAVSRSRELYPEAFNESISTGVRFIGKGRYQVDITLRSGAIRSYLDSGTRLAFYERQRHELAPDSDAPVAVETENETRVAVNRTYPGGPLRIAVTDTDSGAPKDALVDVAGHRISTDQSGVAWTLGPPALEFPVVVVTDSGTVSMTVRPIQPPRLGG